MPHSYSNSRSKAKPYSNLSSLSPQVKSIIKELNEQESYWGLYAAIAKKYGVSRCWVWQIAIRLRKHHQIKEG